MIGLQLSGQAVLGEQARTQTPDLSAAPFAAELGECHGDRRVGLGPQPTAQPVELGQHGDGGGRAELAAQDGLTDDLDRCRRLGGLVVSGLMEGEAAASALGGDHSGAVRDRAGAALAQGRGMLAQPGDAVPALGGRDPALSDRLRGDGDDGRAHRPIEIVELAHDRAQLVARVLPGEVPDRARCLARGNDRCAGGCEIRCLGHVFIVHMFDSCVKVSADRNRSRQGTLPVPSRTSGGQRPRESGLRVRSG